MADMRQAFEDQLRKDAAAPDMAAPEQAEMDMVCPMCGASAKKIEAAQAPAAPPAGGMGGGLVGGMK